MQHLLIDLGNTRIKWKLADDDALHASEPGAEICELLLVFKKRYPELGAISVVSVKDRSVNAQIADVVRGYWGIEPYMASVSSASCGLQCGYEDPGLLGVDRWLAAIGAYHLAGRQAVCVVDIGSATTVDVVTADGLHRGGFIIPGLHLSVRSLLSGTSLVKIDSDDFMAAGLALGRDTQRAVLNGAVLAQVAFIEAVVSRLSEGQESSLLQLYVTGGGAPLIKSHLSVSYCFIEDLVLRGLLMVSHEALQNK